MSGEIPSPDDITTDQAVLTTMFGLRLLAAGKFSPDFGAAYRAIIEPLSIALCSITVTTSL